MPSAVDPETTIYFTAELRAQWPAPLAAQWAAAYPSLFDNDDLRNTRLQPKNHFHEWFAAIHIFQRDGALSLIEKYLFPKHTRKAEVLRQLLSDSQLAALHHIHSSLGIQPPDLLVYAPDRSRFWFAEVKGRGDKLRPRQPQSHAAIRQELRVPVEIITVRRATRRAMRDAGSG